MTEKIKKLTTNKKQTVHGCRNTSKVNVAQVHDSGHYPPNLIHVINRKVQDFHGSLHGSKQFSISHRLPITVIGEVTGHAITLWSRVCQGAV